MGVPLSFVAVRYVFAGSYSTIIEQCKPRTTYKFRT